MAGPLTDEQLWGAPQEPLRWERTCRTCVWSYEAEAGQWRCLAHMNPMTGARVIDPDAPACGDYR